MALSSFLALRILLCLACAAAASIGGPRATAVPAKTVGFYVLCADDTDPTYTSLTNWTPMLPPYLETGANLLFLTFINPKLMPAVPPSMVNLAQSRGNAAPGSVPAGTGILFSIGGEYYSSGENPWPWLVSTEAAEAMAAQVAKWPSLYGCDGIDIDIETGAGEDAEAGPALVAFAAKIKELNPTMIVSMPVFGSPSSVPGADYALEGSFNSSFPGTLPNSLNSIQRVGIMYYSGSGSLNYVSTYINACHTCTEWYCPLAACVPANIIMVGAAGDAQAADISDLAQGVVSGGLGGIMVWYASMLDRATGQPALSYGAEDDASNAMHAATQPLWAQALAQIVGKATNSSTVL